MDALIKVMPAKKALDWCIRGLSVDAKDCLEMIVIDEINNEINKGRVLIDGDTWRSKSLNNEIIKKNSTVQIVKIESTILIVKNI
jgi:membrane-bound ClpP family serine protease